MVCQVHETDSDDDGAFCAAESDAPDAVRVGLREGVDRSDHPGVQVQLGGYGSKRYTRGRPGIRQ